MVSSLEMLDLLFQVPQSLHKSKNIQKNATIASLKTA